MGGGGSISNTRLSSVEVKNMGVYTVQLLMSGLKKTNGNLELKSYSLTLKLGIRI